MEHLAAFFASRVGLPVATLLIGLLIGWWKTDASWQEYEAKQRAAQEVLHQMELAREAANAVEIAKAATERVEEDSAELVSLQKQVSDFDRGETNAKTPCVIDDDFHAAASRLRYHPKARRPAKVARPPK